jgi:predicted transposase YdaD
MGGEIIEMDVIKAHREGMVEGIEEGRAEGREEGREEGRAEGREEGIRVFIEDKLEDAVSEDIILKKLEKNYGLTTEKAVEYIKKYSGVKTA